MSPEKISKAIQDKLDNLQESIDETREILIQEINSKHSTMMIEAAMALFLGFRTFHSYLEGERDAIRSSADIEDRTALLLDAIWERLSNAPHTSMHQARAFHDTWVFLCSLIDQKEQS